MGSSDLCTASVCSPPHLTSFPTFLACSSSFQMTQLFFLELLWPGTHCITLNNCTSLLYSIMDKFIINSHMAILIVLFSIILEYKLPNQINLIYSLSKLVYDSDSSLVQLRNVIISQFCSDFITSCYF